jgi:hypothetical protein
MASFNRYIFLAYSVTGGSCYIETGGEALACNFSSGCAGSTYTHQISTNLSSDAAPSVERQQSGSDTRDQDAHWRYAVLQIR